MSFAYMLWCFYFVFLQYVYISVSIPGPSSSAASFDDEMADIARIISEVDKVAKPELPA